MSIIPTTLTIVLEEIVNSYLSQNRPCYLSHALLMDKVIRLQIIELPFPLTFYFTINRVFILRNDPMKADCVVTMPLSLLILLRNRSNIISLMYGQQLHVMGDMQILMQVFSLLNETKWDCELWVSQYIGNVLAYNIIATSHDCLKILKTPLMRQKRWLYKLLVQKKCLLLDQSEFMAFKNIKKLRHGAKLLKSGLKQLSQKVQHCLHEME